MKAIEHSIDIAAPPHVVWDVLMDAAAYEEWNPFLSMERPPAAVGDKLAITVRPGRRTMSFRPTVTVFEPEREVSWLGHLLVPGLVDGAHSLRVELTDDGGTRFHQRETFRGVLVPLLSSMLRDTSHGFAAMNAALATRAETSGTTERN
jgi:hypothetical protein